MNIRMAGDRLAEALGKAQSFAETALVADLIRGKQIAHGQLVYGNPGEVFQEARRWALEGTGGREPSPMEIRAAVPRVMSARRTMIEDGLDVLFDDDGPQFADLRGAPAPVSDADWEIKRMQYRQQEELHRQREAELRQSLAEAGILGVDEDLPF